MNYELRANRGLMKLKIHYWTAGSYEVYANGKFVEPNDWDKDEGNQGALTKNRGCGENRYLGVVNILEFVITPYCLIEVRPRDAIMTNVRMEWT